MVVGPGFRTTSPRETVALGDTPARSPLYQGEGFVYRIGGVCYGPDPDPCVPSSSVTKRTSPSVFFSLGQRLGWRGHAEPLRP